jgi:UDP:flavonoid glycosyltransferase YjiC (YdhE family)
MSRILLVWELGLGLGHTGRLGPLAAALERRGHEPVFALKDLTAAAGPMFEGTRWRMLQSPVWINEVLGLPPPVGLAETLLRFGFYDAPSLAAVAQGWRDLVDLVQPDLILFDHAPTALLATRGLGVPRALYGDGFCAPPAIDPWPAYRWWANSPTARIVDSTRHALGIANEVMKHLDSPALDQLCDLYATDENFLLALPEIDHYPERTQTRYWGPVFSAGRGVEPRWPIAGEKRLFAYVTPTAPWFPALMDALKRSGASALVFAPGVAARTAKSFSGATMTVSDRPYDMARIRAECDVAVTQSGMGTAAALLLAGKPQLMVPQFVERFMLAKRIEALGAGLIVAPEGANTDLRRPLSRLLGDATFGQAAAAYAQRQGAHDPATTIEAIADRCGELAAGRTT